MFINRKIYVLIQKCLKVAVPEEPPTELNRTFELPSENSVEDLCPKASRSIVTFYVTDYDKGM